MKQFIFIILLAFGFQFTGLSQSIKFPQSSRFPVQSDYVIRNVFPFQDSLALILWQQTIGENRFKLHFSAADPEKGILWTREMGHFTNESFNQFFYLPGVGYWLSGSNIQDLAADEFNSEMTVKEVEMYFSRLNQDGHILWQKPYEKDNTIFHNKVTTITPDNNFLTVYSYIQRSQYAGSQYSKMFIKKVNRESQLIWEKSFLDKSRIPFTIKKTPTDHFMILGGTQQVAGLETTYWVLELDGAGRKIRELEFDIEETVNFHSVEFLPNNDILILAEVMNTSIAPHPPKKDIVVIRFSSSGKLLWRKQFGYPSVDELMIDIIGTEKEIIMGFRRQTYDGYKDEIWINLLDYNGNLIDEETFEIFDTSQFHHFITIQNKHYIFGTKAVNVQGTKKELLIERIAVNP